MNQSAIIAGITAVGLTTIAGAMYLFSGKRQDVTEKTMNAMGNTREVQELRREYQQDKANDSGKYDPNAQTFGGKKRKTRRNIKRKSQTKRKSI